MRTTVLLLFAALVSACVGPPEPTNPLAVPPSRAEEAIAYLWSALGGEGAPPPVHWVAGDCIEPARYEGQCASGRYQDGEIWVLVRPGAAPSRTALPHELLHAALHQQGDSDHNHERPEWDMIRDLSNELARDEM